MAFEEGLNQSLLFPTLMRIFEENRRRKQQEEALQGLFQGLTTTETVPTPPLQAPARQGVIGTGGRQITPNIPALSLAQPPTQEQRQIGLDDPRAMQPVLNYLSSTGQDIGLNTLMGLFQAGQPKFQEIGAGTTYGSVKGGQFTPQGTTDFRPTGAGAGNLNIREFEVLENGKPVRYRDYINELGQKVAPRERLGEAAGGQGSSVPYTFMQTAEGVVPLNRKTGEAGQTTRVGKALTNEMITAEQQISGLRESLNRVKETYKPEYVGAVAGRVGGLAESTVGVPDEQARFYASLADIKNTLIYLKSGKQINESEYQRLLQQLPDRNNPESVFMARMAEFERMLNDIITSRQSNMGGYGTQRQQPTQSKFKILKKE